MCFLSDGQITAILDQKNYVEELNRHLRFVSRTPSFLFLPCSTPTDLLSLCVCSASVNNLQAKVDALEKSNTKLTEEVSPLLLSQGCLLLRTVVLILYVDCVCVCVCAQLAVANNRIITLQEDVERVKEESSYQLESRKVNKITCICFKDFRGTNDLKMTFSTVETPAGLVWYKLKGDQLKLHTEN